jgi:hypothetical protein
MRSPVHRKTGWVAPVMMRASHCAQLGRELQTDTSQTFVAFVRFSLPPHVPPAHHSPPPPHFKPPNVAHGTERVTVLHSPAPQRRVPMSHGLYGMSTLTPAACSSSTTARTPANPPGIASNCIATGSGVTSPDAPAGTDDEAMRVRRPVRAVCGVRWIVGGGWWRESSRDRTATDHPCRCWCLHGRAVQRKRHRRA